MSEDLLNYLTGDTQEIEVLAQPAPRRVPAVPLGNLSVTALAYVLVLGTPDRFRCGKQVGS